MRRFIVGMVAAIAVAPHGQAAAPASFMPRRNNQNQSSTQPHHVTHHHQQSLSLILARTSPAFTRLRGGSDAIPIADGGDAISADVSDAISSAKAETTQTKRRTIALSTNAAVLAGCALAFNSGYVNGACLSGILSSDNTKQAAAAVTGAWTNSALGLASGNTAQFVFNVKCIFSYCSGSLIASLLNPNPVPFEINVSTVSPAFLLGSLFMYASSSVAKKSGGSNRAFIYLAAIACGIQNSVTSVLTSNLVRSAHFSGITSDIGTFLGQVLRGNNTNALKLKVFSMLALSFWMGGIVSFSVTKFFASSSLLFSSALFLFMAVVLLVVD